MNSVNFTGALILVSGGTDEITLYPDNLPTAYPEMKYECCFTMKARHGYGETWIKENFPNLPYEVIKV